MPRWAEAFSLATIAIIAMVALLVYAKFKTQRMQRQAEATARSNEALIEETRTIPDKPSVVIEPSTALDRGADRVALDRAARQATVRTVVEALPSPGPEAASKPSPAPPADAAGQVILMGPPIEASRLARAAEKPDDELFMGPPAHAGGGGAAYAEKAAEEAEKVAKEIAAKPEAPTRIVGVQPGSAEELALVEQAQASLARLHNLRLRPDVPPAAADEEAARLQSIIDQLPPKTAKEVHTLIQKGYNQRLKGPNSGSADAGAQELRDSEAGRYDDTPSDVRALRERTSAMRNRLGAPGRARPVQTKPQVNPRSLPAAKPSNLGTGGQTGGLPSVEARSL